MVGAAGYCRLFLGPPSRFLEMSPCKAGQVFQGFFSGSHTPAVALCYKVPLEVSVLYSQATVVLYILEPMLIITMTSLINIHPKPPGDK